MRITLMRAPICPDPVGDKGVSTFKYRLYPHAGNWSQANTVNYALELNQPLKGYEATAQSGKLSDKSFIEVSRRNIVVDAVKNAQDGNGLIIRMYEAGKSRGKVKVKLNFADVKKVVECNLMEVDETEISVNDNEFEYEIAPNQVRTFRVII